jgi:hypothetical protein
MTLAAIRPHHQPLSWPSGGLSRVGLLDAAPPLDVAADGCWCGLNLSTRNVIQPTSSPFWSCSVSRVLMK